MASITTSACATSSSTSCIEFESRKSLPSGFASIIRNFSTIDSSAVIEFPFNNRQDIIQAYRVINEGSNRSYTPILDPISLPDAPVISSSRFVPPAFVAHLMKNKKNSALGVKYEAVNGAINDNKADQITNAEGAVHTFITPICIIQMTGDYAYNNRHTAIPIQIASSLDGLKPAARTVVLSAAIQPDFENHEVMLPLMQVTDQQVIGYDSTQKLQNPECIPERQLKVCKDFREAYDRELISHLIYHLTLHHRRPDLSQLEPADKMDYDTAVGYILSLVSTVAARSSTKVVGSSTGSDSSSFSAFSDTDAAVFMCASAFQNKVVKLEQRYISLEILFMTYMHQIRNEMCMLDALCTQGFIYTIDPPCLFAKVIGKQGVNILNRIQLLACICLTAIQPFMNLRHIAFSDFADPDMTGLWIKYFASPNLSVTNRTALFPPTKTLDKSGPYRHEMKHALVIHNNSDAFGQNIETEGPSSLDGVVGFYSNAYLALKRDRPDIADFIVY